MWLRRRPNVLSFNALQSFFRKPINVRFSYFGTWFWSQCAKVVAVFGKENWLMILYPSTLIVCEYRDKQSINYQFFNLPIKLLGLLWLYASSHRLNLLWLDLNLSPINYADFFEPKANLNGNLTLECWENLKNQFWFKIGIKYFDFNMLCIWKFCIGRYVYQTLFY